MNIHKLRSPTGSSIQGSLETGQAISYIYEGDLDEYDADDVDDDDIWTGETEWFDQCGTGLWVDQAGEAWLEEHLRPAGTTLSETDIAKMRRETRAEECCIALSSARSAAAHFGIPTGEIDAAIAAVKASVV